LSSVIPTPSPSTFKDDPVFHVEISDATSACANQKDSKQNERSTYVMSVYDDRRSEIGEDLHDNA